MIPPKTKTALEKFLGIPGAVVAMLTVLVLGFKFCGVDLLGPGDKLKRHEAYSQGYHRAIDSTRQHDQQDDVADRAVIEGLARGECLENPCRQLDAQKMIRYCVNLGYERCRRWRDST
jgi:hypothetical protein